MGNFSPVFLKFHMSTRLVDPAAFAMKLTVDSLPPPAPTDIMSLVL